MLSSPFTSSSLSSEAMVRWHRPVWCGASFFRRANVQSFAIIEKSCQHQIETSHLETAQWSYPCTSIEHTHSHSQNMVCEPFIRIKRNNNNGRKGKIGAHIFQPSENWQAKDSNQTKPKQSFRSYVQLNQFKMWCQICKDVSLSKEVSGETN